MTVTHDTSLATFPQKNESEVSKNKMLSGLVRAREVHGDGGGRVGARRWWRSLGAWRWMRSWWRIEVDDVEVEVEVDVEKGRYRESNPDL